MSNDQNPKRKTISIAGSEVTAIRGENDEILQIIQDRSGATIQIHGYSQANGSLRRNVDVIGTPDAVLRAEVLIPQVSQAFDAAGVIAARATASGFEPLTMEVPPSKVSELNATIENIEDNSGTKLQVTQLPPDVLENTQLKIWGTQDQMKTAGDSVEQMLPVPNNGKKKSNSQDTDTDSKRAHPSASYYAQRPQTRKRIFIPSTAVGRLIGKQGSIIRAFQSQSGAFIIVDKDSEANRHAESRGVYIQGDEDQVRQAEDLIKHLMTKIPKETVMQQQGGIGSSEQHAKTSRSPTWQVTNQQTHQTEWHQPNPMLVSLPPNTPGTGYPALQFGNRPHTLQPACGSAEPLMYGQTEQPRNQPDGSYQAGYASWGSYPHPTPVPQQGYTVNPALLYTYGAPTAYEWQQGYAVPNMYGQAGYGGYYLPYPPALWPYYTRSQGGYPVPPAPSYSQSHQSPHVQPQPESHISEPNHAETASQGQGFPQVSTNPDASNSQQSHTMPHAQPRPEAHISEPNHAGNASQGQGSSQLWMNPYAFYSQSYPWIHAHPLPQAPISGPNHSGRTSQRQGSSQASMNPYGSYSQSYYWPHAHNLPQAPISEPNHDGSAHQGHGSSEDVPKTSLP